MNFKSIIMAFGLLAVSVYGQKCTDGVSKCVSLSGEGSAYLECVGGQFVPKNCGGSQKCFNSGDTAAMCV